MARPIVFWGAAGQAIVLEDFLSVAGFELIALFDNDRGVTSPFDAVPIFHGEDGFQGWIATRDPRVSTFCAVAVGGARGEQRYTIQRFLASRGLRPQTLIHPNATVSASARLGAGCQVLARAVIGPRAALGDACIVNTGAIVEHECRLGDGVHVGPGATVAGCVTIDDFAFIGAGAVVLPRLSIGRNAVVGAGAVVTSDVPAGTTVTGVPAKTKALAT